MRSSRRIAPLLLALLVPLAACTRVAAPVRAPSAAATVEREPTSEWMRHAVIYGVVPHLFGHPPLRSVIPRLDALAEQRVDALWIAPVYETDDPSHISYAVTDYQKVRADYGSLDDLRTLVREAHARGLRVILDFVPNHVSTGHPAYQHAEAHGPSSPYHAWFVRDEKGEPTHYFDWAPLKNLDLDHPDASRMVIDGFLFWVREVGVDGFRVDAAWGPRDRHPLFWKRLEAALEAERPDLFLLAEASARDPFYVQHGFDAAYDWTDSLGEWAWKYAFEDLSQIGPRLTAALETSPTPPHQVARFLNNNDTGERFITRHGPELTRVAATLMHLLPGIPMLFTGDEVGAEYEPYDDPPPLDFADPHGLRAHYTKLAELRDTVPAFRHGDYVPLPVLDHPSAFAFLRQTARSNERGSQALVVLNFGSERATLKLALPAASLPLLEGPVEDALGGPSPEVRIVSPGLAEITLPAKHGVALVPATSAPRPAR